MTSPAVDLIPLGGFGEIGLNSLLLSCGGEAVLVDCGLMFPEEEHLGVDVVIPDFTHLAECGDLLRGVVLTHGHEDHIGALPYFLDRFDVPVHGTPLTLALVREKLREFDLESQARLVPVQDGESIALGPFAIEAVAVAHSIPGGVGLAIDTPAGLIVHSGDFKLDPAPVDGRATDLARFAALGDRGVLALLADSTNAEHEGSTPSESSLAPALRAIVADAPGRVIVATFASHIHRIQQVVDIAREMKRRVHLAGRSMVSVVGIASQLGALRLPSSLLADAGELRALPPEKVLILTTGSQGEPLAALSRMAVNDHKQIAILPGDRVVISARVIPGHEKAIARTVNHLFQRGAEVFYGREAGIHVSGHGSRDELRALIAAVRPRHFVPIHGEYRHLARHARLARESGVEPGRVIVAENGDRIRCAGGEAARAGRVAAGRVLVDGKAHGDIHDAVLKDRRRLAQDGIILVIIGVNRQTGEVVSGPDIVTRGVAFAGEEEALLADAREVVAAVLAETGAEVLTEWGEVQIKVRKALRKFVDKRLERRPLILPTVIEI
ncbi:MAG TPA: ribonuclease J [Candidatus Methanoperedens sp.]|nr:ribonuclease J [Candidatus Methanoperedens sp.]